MKRLLIPLLAVLVLPTVVNAETYHLLLKGSAGYGNSTPIGTLAECEIEGNKVIGKNTWKGGGSTIFSYICIKGK